MDSAEVSYFRRMNPNEGEYNARVGYAYQDRIAARLALAAMSDPSHRGDFQEVILGEPSAGQADDLLLVWSSEVHGHQMKYSDDADADSNPVHWSELVGKGGWLSGLVDGSISLQNTFKRSVRISLHTNRAANTRKDNLVKSATVADFITISRLRTAEHERHSVWQEITSAINKGRTAGNQVSEDDLRNFFRSSELIFREPWDDPNPGTGFSAEERAANLAQLGAMFSGWFEQAREAKRNGDKAPSFSHDELKKYLVPGRYLRLSHAYPVPADLVPIQRAREIRRIHDVVQSLQSGYVAISGAAGTGKSTLVRKAIENLGIVIPYYVYLPGEGGDPRDRASSSTFFSDIVERLENRLGISAGGGVGSRDSQSGREKLRMLFKEASARGLRLILLIDGLDHLQRITLGAPSFAADLPDPNDLSDGCFIVLSAQPQAFQAGLLPSVVSTVLAPTKGRHITIEGFDKGETRAALGDLISSDWDVQQAFESTKGHPLALTYLARACREEGKTIHEVSSKRPIFTGDIADYYGRLLEGDLVDPAKWRSVQLWASCRPGPPESWMRTWGESWKAFEQLRTGALAGTIRSENGRWFPVHESLLRYLREKDDETDSRSIHSELADLVPKGLPGNDSLARLRIYHLYRAGRSAQARSELTLPFVWRAAADLISFEELGDALREAIATASEDGDAFSLIKAIIATREFDMRASRAQPTTKAELRILQQRPYEALEFAAEDAEFGSPETPLEYAYKVGIEALQGGLPELYRSAKRLFEGSIPDLLSDRESQWQAEMAWARASCLFNGIEATWATISDAELSMPIPMSEQIELGQDIESRWASLRHIVHREAWLDKKVPEETFAVAIDAIDPPEWAFLAWRVVYQNATRRPDLEQLASKAYVEMSRLAPAVNLEIQEALNLAEAAIDNGEVEQARRWLNGIDNPLDKNWKDAPLSVAVRLGSLCDLTGAPFPTISERERKDRWDEERWPRWYPAAVARARAVGIAANAMKRGDAMPMRKAISDLLFALDFDFMESRIPDFRPQRESIALERALALCDGQRPIGPQIFAESLAELPRPLALLPATRRTIAKSLYESGVWDSDEAASYGQGSLPENEEDPYMRVSEAIEAAHFFASVGAQKLALQFISPERIEAFSYGVLDDKDPYWIFIADGFERGLSRPGGRERAERFVHAMTDGGRYCEVAAGKLVRAYSAQSPVSAAKLAAEMVQMGIWTVPEALEDVFLAALEADADPSVLIAAWCNCLAPYANDFSGPSTLRRLVEYLRVELSSEATATLRRAVETRAPRNVRVELLKVLSPPEEASELVLKLSDPTSKEDWPQSWRGEEPPSETSLGASDLIEALGNVKVQNAEHLLLLEQQFPVVNMQGPYYSVRFLTKFAVQWIELNRPEIAVDRLYQAIRCSNGEGWSVRLDGGFTLEVLNLLRPLVKRSEIDRLAQTTFAQVVRSGAGGRFLISSLFMDIPLLVSAIGLAWPKEADQLFDEVIAPIFSHVPEPPGPLASGDFLGTISGGTYALMEFLTHFVASPSRDWAGLCAKVVLEWFRVGGSDALSVLSGREWNDEELDVLLRLLLAACPDPTTALRVELQNWVSTHLNHPSSAVRKAARSLLT